MKNIFNLTEEEKLAIMEQHTAMKSIIEQAAQQPAARPAAARPAAQQPAARPAAQQPKPVATTPKPTTAKPKTTAQKTTGQSTQQTPPPTDSLMNETAVKNCLDTTYNKLNEMGKSPKGGLRYNLSGLVTTFYLNGRYSQQYTKTKGFFNCTTGRAVLTPDSANSNTSPTKQTAPQQG
jgi:hypothetical protein